MRRYVAKSTPDGVEVSVHHSEQPGDMVPLSNPPLWTKGGFEWGYAGAGPRRLAHAILTDLVAAKFGDAFMEEVVSKTSPIEERGQEVVFHEEDVLAWFKKKLL